MSVQVETLEKNMAKVTVEVSEDKVEAAIQQAYQRQKSKIRIPGFRKGKVPRKMIEKMYGPDVFYEDAANQLIRENWGPAADESGVEIVSRPVIDITQIEAGKPFIFTAEVAVKPEVKLGEYKGISVAKSEVSVTDEEVEQAARTAGAHSFIMRLEHGYDTMIEGDGANLSQGQRQLLNIARAAVSKAPILVLDEATSSVDTRTEKHIEHGMDRIMAERTTLVIAHRLSTVRNADAILVLENGEIIERGNHEELLERKGRYYNLYTGLCELT